MPYVKETTKLRQIPKFVFFSAHDSELQPLFSSLGKFLVTNPTPGSAIFFEFYIKSETKNATTTAKNLHVRIFYKQFQKSK